MDKILTGLVGYTVYHFGSEEKLFEKHGYPETREHIEKLKKLVGRVSDFYESFKKGDAEVNFDLMEFLKDWLNNHIKGTDKKYGAFFNFKGVN